MGSHDKIAWSLFAPFRCFRLVAVPGSYDGTPIPSLQLDRRPRRVVVRAFLVHSFEGAILSQLMIPSHNDRHQPGRALLEPFARQAVVLGNGRRGDPCWPLANYRSPRQLMRLSPAMTFSIDFKDVDRRQCPVTSFNWTRAEICGVSWMWSPPTLRFAGVDRTRRYPVVQAPGHRWTRHRGHRGQLSVGRLCRRRHGG